MVGTSACFECGIIGHKRKDCPVGSKKGEKKAQIKNDLSFDNALVHRGKKERHPYPTYQKCGRMHMGECMAGRDDCFVCGGIGHKRRHCPVVARRGKERAWAALTGMHEIP